ncbi:MAG: impB/mucB/samB family protein [Alphaproteobacteria bacterium]|nr:impB/mucB/samB family protein [Alphaproteobacteria bacterium]
MIFDHSQHPAAQLRWIYIDFNSYFASVEQQLNPQLRGKPVVVTPVDSDFTSAIAASYEAKAFGIKTGTPIHEAKRLCKDVICVLANHENYVSFHNRIRSEVEKHIPITKVCSIDEVACRLMDNETAPERAIEISMAIKRGLAENIGEAVTCSIGIAPNMFLAKVAGEMQKPDGLVVLPLADLPGPLLRLKLNDIPGIGRNMNERLHRKGISNMQGLWKLSPLELRKAWGSVWGERMWYYLRGAELQEQPTTRRSIGHSHVLSPEVRPPDKARLVARRLTLKAASRLRRMNFYAAYFSVSVRLENGRRHFAESHCYRAQDSLTFLHLLDKHWQEIAAQIGTERIKKVSINMQHLVDANDLQPELLPELPEQDLKSRKKWESMSQALDKINQRYGRDTISIGGETDQKKGFTGTKIAFTRIPDEEEFRE